jgi:hypothetical protein
MKPLLGPTPIAGENFPIPGKGVSIGQDIPTHTIMAAF